MVSSRVRLIRDRQIGSPPLTDAAPPAPGPEPTPDTLGVGGDQADTLYIFVVCTDRGQHRRRVLTITRVHPDGTGGMSSALDWFAPPMGDEATPRSLMGRDSYIFRCPSCSRTPQINRAKWWNLVGEALRLQLPEIDLSLLPF